ncbi:Rv2175c family DNA-binding protein [Brachybacterium muris]|uniref:Rv2175c family DNA-binding protein n=1 Tax=Brachybacterium muris TaxID=219301 RepID=UPI0003638A2A|nr:Rv2175c family DNA-binding protein [Brachybacterium muris]MCT2296517.1 Rv2175c family DNA-binding protein [Brachybacterium muris]
MIDRARPGGRGTLVGVNELDDLIPSWLTLPDVARVLDVEVSRVRRLIDEGELVAVRRGDPVVRSVPADLLLDGDIAPHLGGTITVLRDGGFEDEELLRWLFTEDETLPGRPIDHLRRGQRGEVRRRAQALAF